MSGMPEQEFVIDRREAVRRVMALLGGTALVGGSSLIAACGKDRTQAQAGIGTFTAADIAYLDEIAETILPETQTPGAKAAKVGAFMALMVTDTYEADEQTIFKNGMQQLNQASITANSGASFIDATPEQRLALLESLDKEAKTYQDDKKDEDPDHYFRMMKQLTLLGYFTSEIGCTQAQRYVEAPGRFDPCLPYTPGERSWANHA
ncbi:MAG TPA: gluconate 2-dehydrogenase subunit 3 family protein [Gemmatimonadaceae bacterium]|nr:gluconate 2-dehydrogenase subunit 3 family protein [Gemmatimonadaceae bacterium]